VSGIVARELSLPPLFVEMGYVYPAPVPADRARRIAEIATGALEACGQLDGESRVTIRWTAGGPQVVSVRPRLGSDPASRLARLAAHAGTAALAHFWLPAGELEQAGGADEIRALEYVHELVFPFRPGDRIPPTTDARSRHGHVVVTAPSGAEAAARIAAVKAMLTVTVRQRSAIPRPRVGS
jgi:hypothetical protein